MNGIDFSKYPAAMKFIQENKLDKANEYPMIYMGRDETAVYLAEMLLLCQAALSNSIPLRRRSKVSTVFYFNQVRSKSNLIAQVQALADYGLTFDDMYNLLSNRT